MMRKTPKKQGLDERLSAWFTTVRAMADLLDDMADLRAPVVQAALIESAARLITGADTSVFTAPDSPFRRAPEAEPEAESPEALLPTDCAVCGKPVYKASDGTFKAVGWVHNVPACLLEDPTLNPASGKLRALD